LARFPSVDRSDFVIPKEVALQPTGATSIPRGIVDSCHRDPVTMVENRVGPFRRQVQEVLRAPWRDVGGVKISRAVIDRLAEGVGRLELQTIAEAAIQLGLQSVIHGSAPRHESCNRTEKPGIHILGAKEAAPSTIVRSRNTYVVISV